MYKISTGDTAWILISTALVMIMTPALSLFYGGMVRSKNMLATVMQSFVALGIVSILWVTYGYSLSFGPDFHHIIGILPLLRRSACHMSSLVGNVIRIYLLQHHCIVLLVL